MPYIWLSGLIYYGINDNVPSVILWCVLFVALAFLKHITIEHLMKMEATAYRYMIDIIDIDAYCHSQMKIREIR